MYKCNTAGRLCYAYCQEVQRKQSETLAEVQTALVEEQLAHGQEKATAGKTVHDVQVLVILARFKLPQQIGDDKSTSLDPLVLNSARTHCHHSGIDWCMQVACPLHQAPHFMT